MNELALFAGAGGGLLATKHLLGWRTVCYVEKDPYCVEVLKARIREGTLDDAPIWYDAQTFDGRPWRGAVDIITAGFPCQPWSNAGKQKGADDDRNLWPSTFRIIEQVSPKYVCLENVPAIVCQPYFREHIITALASFLSGNGGGWIWGNCLSAAAIGANHIRERLWIVACTYGDGVLADANSGRQQEHTDEREGEAIVFSRANFARRHFAIREAFHEWWRVEPKVGRMVDGMAHRVGQLRAIGNGQVPAVVEAVCRVTNIT